ncbi:hypothetical protein skT53_18880 [Effusibacillus dendaii]|uniref:NADP-dependent oxidoreductase domain-containing protein n=1 Tax=Effusibacillus dendaii TaxID=2743772 RepID=A0A7I8D9Q9_9BACL|nr:hypothetical protein skT53_18880 [Effusibacillus dendaii]
MPWLGLGVWMAEDGEEVENAVRTAIEVGYRSIDTATVYKLYLIHWAVPDKYKETWRALEKL